MEQKLVEEKEAVEVTGKAKFENGKLIPLVKNGKTTKINQKQLKELLDKKQKCDKKSRQKSAKPKKEKVKKEFEPEHRNKFADKMVIEVKGLERVDKKEKVLLKLGRNQVVRLMLRKSSWFTAYKNMGDGCRESMRVGSTEDEAVLEKWIKQRVEELSTKQIKKKERKMQKPKGSVVRKLEQAETKARKAKGTGFDLSKNKIKVTDAVKTWVADHNYKIEANVIRF